jgi:hypothetical protein
MIQKIQIGQLSTRPITKVFVIIVAAAVFCACRKDKNDTNSVVCSGSPKSFSADVRPIVQSSCATDTDCHGAGSVSGPGPLLDYSAVFNARFDIRSSVSSGHMPLNGSLTPSEKNAIICWIENGAPNN